MLTTLQNKVVVNIVAELELTNHRLTESLKLEKVSKTETLADHNAVK